MSITETTVRKSKPWDIKENQHVTNSIATVVPVKSIKPWRSRTMQNRKPEWICPDKRCGYNNYSSRLECKACNKPKQPNLLPMKSLGDWYCKKDECNEFNFKSRQKCRKCNALKSF